MTETKQNIVGIAIPEECGKADMYEITAIMYHDENSDKEETEYQVFITREDFEKSTPFATLKANMNPEVLLFPDDEHEGIGWHLRILRFLISLVHMCSLVNLVYGDYSTG